MGGLTGARTVLDGREYPWDRQTGAGEDFAPAVPGQEGFAPNVSREPQPPLLVPVRLPHPQGMIELDVRTGDGNIWTGGLIAPVPCLAPSGDLPPRRHAVRWERKDMDQ